MRLDNRSHTLASILSQTLKGTEVDTKLKENTCLLVWDEIVGDQVSGASQPDYVRDGILLVITRSPVWANELSFYKGDIIAKLNDRARGNVIKDIVFKAGRMAPKKKAKPKQPFSELALENIELNEDEVRFIEKTAASACEASGEIMKLMESALKLNKWRRLQ